MVSHSDEVNRFAYVPKDWMDVLSSQHRGNQRRVVWRLPVFVLALLLSSSDLVSLSFVIGILYILAIFEFGWFGGGDAQLVFDLVGFQEFELA